MHRSRDCNIRYEGLVEPNMAMAPRARSLKTAGAVFETWRYPPPVRAGRVLWALSQQRSAPRSMGCRGSFRKWR